MQTGPSPRRATRVNLGLRTDATWDQCQRALQGSSAVRIAVVDSSDSNAWYPTSQSELAAAVRAATVATKNWPSIIGVNF
jgi:hypothetical protein